MSTLLISRPDFVEWLRKNLRQVNIWEEGRSRWKLLEVHGQLPKEFQGKGVGPIR